MQKYSHNQYTVVEFLGESRTTKVALDKFMLECIAISCVRFGRISHQWSMWYMGVLDAQGGIELTISVV